MLVEESVEVKTISDKIKLKKAIKRNCFVYSLIGTQILGFMLFYVYVNFNSLIMCFQKTDINGVAHWTLNNFKYVFDGFKEGGALWMPLRNTFIYWTFGFILIPFQILPSYFLYKKIWCHKIFRIVFFFPTIISAVVWSFLFTSLVGAQGPIAPLFQKMFGLKDIPIFLGDSRYALATVLIYGWWMGIPGSFVIYSGTLTRIPSEVIEAGKLDGIKWFRELFQIILPMIWPTVATNALLCLTGIFTSSGNLLLLTGGEFGTNSISFYIFQQVFNLPETSNTYNYAAAIGMFFTVISLPIVFIAQHFMNKVDNVEY